MILEPELETMPREELGTLQTERLRELISYLHERVPFYRHKLDEAGVGPMDVRSLDDLERLPFTRKDDLRDHYPLHLLAVPIEEVARIHASSGTTGKMTVVAYTRTDLDVFARVNARCLAMAGAEPGMMLHNAYGYGLFTGGLGLHDGGERLGLNVVPVSGGMTERQLTLIADLRPQVIACTPSYALTLAHAFRERGVQPHEISLEIALLGAEPWTETMRAEIDTLLGVRSTNLFGLSEIIGPGVSGECAEARDGLHVQEDHFLPEIVDRESGDPLPEGEEGVLVFTTLTKQALPLLRYWTGDIASLTREPCSCGRTLVRMSPIRGRADDMLIVRGVNLYPTQVEEVLGRVPELTAHYRLVVTREATLDEIEVQTEVTPGFFSSVGAELLSGEVVEADEVLRELRDRISSLIKGTLGCTMSVTLMGPGTVPRSEGGKLQRVVDRRQLV
ncbi:MAG: phenylacetate-CoA ligase [Thermoleophilia bacterium]|nr:phenylacetate-CoA ligase [Thermoleophilia bacterium]